LKKYLYDYKLVRKYKKEQIDRILNDPNIIRNRLKIEACVNNAIMYNEIINKYGSFSNYIESFGNTDEESVLERIKNNLMRFELLGPITAYHFMLDMGLKVWKPDRVICRILNRLGLLDDLQDIEQAVKLGREIANQVHEPIRYLDIIFVKYGQQGDEEPFGLKTGICLEKNPRCSICGVKDYCTFRNV
jgi:DNA-3-methyladenine glycosylase I